MRLIAQILLTLAALMYTVAPPLVDFNTTHALHPEWTGHARFHMVWLVVANSLIGLLALFLIWARANSGGLVLGGIMTAMILGGFMVAAITMPLYDGALADAAGGVEAGPGGIDSNLMLFTIGFLINAAGLALAALAKRTA
ncbi:MAG: hypothetical protein AAF829_04785 [Pseudomonadota bacterium]